MAATTKVIVFSYTPAWLASVLMIVPSLGVVGTIASLYSLCLLYLGLPVIMETPAEKRAAYFIIVAVVTIAVAMIMDLISGLVLSPIHLNGVALLQVAPFGGLEVSL